MAGDYLKLQRHYGPLVTDLDLTVLDMDGTRPAVVSPRASTYQVYIQKITFAPSVYAAVVLTFKDSAGVVIGKFSIPATEPTTGADDGMRMLDFGPNGTPLTLGATLAIGFAGVGVAGRVHIEAYQRLGQTISVSTNTNTGTASSAN